MAVLHAKALSMLENSIGVSDMCLLEPLDEDNFIQNLQCRYMNNHIYTYIGNVVISVNPYAELPLYTPDLISEYRSRNIYELPPHIYAISDDAYRSMRDRNQDQCVIISGESGAGKTEASKVIMQYVAAVSGKGKDIDQVKEQLLQCNPVLEAFGNAKTIRNDNSSRFGKYMDIEFDFKGDPVGGVITNYLLEKSRVLVQNRGERSFHVFYQLLSGANTSFLKAIKLQRNPENYLFLKPGGIHTCDSIDDKLNYNITTRAMQVIGFSEDEIVLAFQLVACVLKLGNLHFNHFSNIDGTDGARITNDGEIYEVCDLLQCDSELLIAALKQRTVETCGEKVRTDLSATEATYARDALCKALYARLFTWLVGRVNDSIRVRSRVRRKSMGVLDIYGFEVFEVNSFEQFIINYCNEKLQQIFIELTLKEEQEEYIAEGIEWIHVDYFNNAIICELIEKNNVGLLAMLDEECLRPGHVSDQTFLEKMSQNCTDHDHFQSRACRKTQSDKSLPHNAFRLQHYAGTVTYLVDGFIDKNNDLLYRDLSQAMYQCNHSLLQLLFPEGNPNKIQRRRPPTAGTQFKSSVSALMQNLESKCPNYIRCVKPNADKKPLVFTEEIVRHQVRYLGLMENVRVKRAGYAFRQIYEQFLARYKMLAIQTWPNWHGNVIHGVEALLKSLEVGHEDFALGNTKIFIRNPRTLFALEECRRDRLHGLAILIQKAWRGWAQRVKFLIMKQAQVIISSHFKCYRDRKRYLALRKAAITISAFTRGWKARKIASELRYQQLCTWAVSVIRKYFFGWKVRKEYRKKFRAIAGPKIVNYLQNYMRWRFLIKLRDALPSDSPADKSWPPCNMIYREASENIRWLHHKWRCARYRMRCSGEWRSRMREKVVASDIFRDRKANYPVSIPHEFQGEYVRLQNNQKWKKIAVETNDKNVLFADIVMKVNRKNGKMVLQLLIISTNAVLVLDQRTLGIKYRIPVSEIHAMSLSPYFDKVLILHLKKQENGDILMKKGDFLLSSDHVIEIVAKLYLLIQNTTCRSPDVLIANHMNAEINGSTVDVMFKTGLPEIPPGVIRVIRKSNKLEILQC